MEGMEQILPINGPMNQDNDPRYIKSSDGEVISRVNLRPNSIDGKRWTNQKLKGNEVIGIDYHTGDPFHLPAGENVEIGWCKDFQSDAIIYCIYNTYIDPITQIEYHRHCILRYYQKLKKIEKIWFERPSLGFENTQIRPVVAENMFYWINGEEKPKSFVIHKAINYTNNVTTSGDGSAYDTNDSPLNEKVFPLIKTPPRFSPTSIFGNDNTINYNNLRKKQFQFKYCYEYAENQFSAWSPISKIPLPTGELYYNGIWVDNLYINNKLTVTLDTGSHQVIKIIVAARDCFPLNAGSFWQFSIIKKYDNTNAQVINDDINYSFDFYNNKNTGSIDTPINNRYCDDVPLSAKDILLLDGKYLSMVYPLKGYDYEEELDYTLTPFEEQVDFTHQEVTIPKTTTILTSAIVYCGHTTAVRTVTEFTIPPTFYPNSIYQITMVVGSGGINSMTAMYATTTVQPTNFQQVIRDSLYDQLAAKYNDCTHFEYLQVFKWGTTQIRTIVYGYGGVVPHTGKIIIAAYNSVNKGFKRGQYHPFGIIYNDEFGRYNIVYGDEEFFSPLVSVDLDKFVKCSWEINHTPPIWATTYRWCYIKNKTYTYFLYVPNIKVLREEDNDTIPTGYVLLRINQALQEIKDDFPNNIIPEYSWVNGDRIRIVGSDKTFEILRQFTPDADTLDIDGDPIVPAPDNDPGFLVDGNFYPNSGTLPNIISLVEIFRPNPTPQETVYMEIGEDYEIIDAKTPTRRHQGQTQDQLGALPAKGVFDFGDIYFRERIGSDAVYYPVEDANFSDYYVSDSIDIGRVGAKIDSEQKYLNSIVRGEQFIEGSLTNLLNVFLFETKHFDASDIYGRITGVEEMGGTLKVIQTHKESSIMIGEVTAKQADMGDWIFIGDTVFGAVRRYEEDRGTIYRRSFAVNNRYAYYFDEATGEFIRSSPNGQAAISKEYNMQNWFEKKAKELREYTGVKDVITAFDNDYEEVIVTFRMGNENETVVFCEKEGSKGWNYHGKYYSDNDVPEDFASYKDVLISFLNGQLYLHGNGPNNTFYGKLHDCSISFPTNMYPAVMKRYSSIRISSNKNIWYIRFDIEEGENYPTQKSILVPAYMREKENAIYSDILRSILKRNGVEDINIIHTGNRMVGESMVVTLSDATVQSVNLGPTQINFLIER